jgi:hypothetical protein
MSLLQEDTAILNIYASNQRTSESMVQKLIKLKVKKGESTFIVEYLDSLLEDMYRFNRQKISRTYFTSTISSIN